jgi:hypothetical protein
MSSLAFIAWVQCKFDLFRSNNLVKYRLCDSPSYLISEYESEL